MKIAFLAARLEKNQFQQKYTLIVEYLEKNGHHIVQKGDIKNCDLIIAECSQPCITVGYEIGYALQNEREVIILKYKNREQGHAHHDDLFAHKNIYLYEYTDFDLLEVIKEAVSYNSSKKFKKYNILFPTDMVVKLNNVAKKKNLPKSVYIRQLLEKGLASEEY